MRRLLLIAGLLAAFAGYADVYRWVDENGQVHFSDRPREGAERVELQEPQTFSAPASRRPPRTPDNSSADQAPFSYETLAITSPGQEETLWNIEGQLDVSMRLSPRLQRGHELRLYLDGQQVEQLQAGSTRVRLTDVYRGNHSLRAEVVDAGGRTLIQSEPVNFFVRQTSVQNPNNPNAPRPTPLAR